MIMANLTKKWLLALAMTLPLGAHADEQSPFEFSGTGFLTLGIGKMLSGNAATVLDRTCPCFIADYAQGAIYTGDSGLQFGPDSKLGLQGTAKLAGSAFSVTAQAATRGAKNGQVDLGWLYGSYDLTDSTVVQFGRKRLPMFYYSDIQDVGFALPWTHLPPQQYGWEAVNYNGINVLHRTRLGEWATTLNVLAGSERVSNSGYWKVYNGTQSNTSVSWDKILGGELSFAKDWFETRFVYIQSETSRVATNAFTPSSDSSQNGGITQQQIYSAAFNVDLEDWLLRSEILYINRPGANYRDHSFLVAGGKRFGNWLLMATTSTYRSEAVESMGANPLAQESHRSESITVRYDLNESSDVKIQLDQQTDFSGTQWTPRYGDALLLTAAYDKVF